MPFVNRIAAKFSTNSNKANKGEDGSGSQRLAGRRSTKRTADTKRYLKTMVIERDVRDLYDTCIRPVGHDYFKGRHKSLKH